MERGLWLLGLVCWLGSGSLSGNCRDEPVADGIGLKTVWKQPLGKGYSGLAIGPGTVVTMFSDGTNDVVAAFDRENGTRLWQFDLGPTNRGHDGSQDGPISTPCIHEGLVFALSPRGKLHALSLSDGNELWTVDLVTDHQAPPPHWGFGTSPLVAGGVLIVEAGAPQAMVLGLDPATGKKLWTAGEDSVHYQSPVLETAGDESRILASGNAKVICLESATGVTVWEYAHEGGGEYGSICLVPVPLADGRILLKHADDKVKVIRPMGEGTGTAINVAWEGPAFRKTYAVPVHHDGLLFGYTSRLLNCARADTGDVLWRSRPPGDGFPVIANGHLVVFCKSGEVCVARPDPAGYAELAASKVFEDLVWATPAVSGNSLFARSYGEIARIDLVTGEGTAIPAPVAVSARAPKFAQLVAAVESAADKSTAVETFLRDHGPFPMVEDGGWVTFVYRGPGKELAVGGDLTGFGGKLPMERVPGADLFHVSTQLEPDARISYAIVRDFMAIPDPLGTNRTMLTGMDDDLEMDFFAGEREVSSLAMPDWKPPTHYGETPADRRGLTVERTLQSKVMEKELRLSVHLPAGYEGTDMRFPVVYVHSGASVRDKLELPLALDNLAGGEMQPLIAVFILEEPPFFGVEKYAELCGREIPEYVDGQFRTLAKRENRAQVGWGFSGQAIAQSALTHAELNGKLGLTSPFIISPDQLKPFMKPAAEFPLDVYIDWGKYDTRAPLESWDVARFGSLLTEAFRANGYEPLGGEFHEGSDVPAWRNRTDDLFRALFPAK